MQATTTLDKTLASDIQLFHKPPLAGRNRINIDLITANWPDMLRLAGSLTAGTVRASEILRVTQGGGTATLLEKRWRSTAE